MHSKETISTWQPLYFSQFVRFQKITTEFVFCIQTDIKNIKVDEIDLFNCFKMTVVLNSS